MNVLKVLGGVACLSVLLGTGAFAEIAGGEPGTSKIPKDNVPEQIQEESDYLKGDGPQSSGPGSRNDALSAMKKEKAVKEGHAALDKNAKKTHEGGAAVATQEIEQQGEEQLSHSGEALKASKELEAKGKEKISHKGGAAKTAEGLKEKGEKSHKDISAQSSHKGMKKDLKKKLPKKELQLADPLEKE